MCEAVPRFPTPSWRDAQLKHRDNFTFTQMVFERGALALDD